MPDGVNIPGGPSFSGNPKPPDVPCDPTGDGWRGPPGPPGSSATGAANVKDYGAVGNGIANDTSAIRAAIATGNTVYFPTGTYLVTDALDLTKMGQRLYGDGLSNTVISVPASFNLSAAGVFNISATHGDTVESYFQSGASISDLTIEFAQVDTNIKANLLQFPPAINIHNSQRWWITRVCIKRGWNGIYAYANNTIAGAQNSVGGGYMVDVQLGCLNENIHIDGAADTTRIRGAHIFPWGCTGNQMQIFQNPASCTGVMSYRADHLTIDGCLFFVGLGIHMSSNTNGMGLVQVSGCDFDTFSGIQVDYGSLTVANCLFIPAAANCIGLSLNIGAEVDIAACKFWVQDATSRAIAVRPIGGGNAFLAVNGATIYTGALDIPSVAINDNTSPGSSVVILSNIWFGRDPTVHYVNPTVMSIGNSAQLLVTNCKADPLTTGSGVFVQITGAGTNNRVVGCVSTGWTNQIGGAPFVLANSQSLAWQDTTGGTIVLTLASDNNFYLTGTDGAGGQRNFFGIAQHSSTSVFGFSVPVQHVSTIGFNNTAPIAKPTVSGAKGSNAALASLMTALAAYGLVTDSTTA